jgi:hypothetical protein
MLLGGEEIESKINKEMWFSLHATSNILECQNQFGTSCLFRRPNALCQRVPRSSFVKNRGGCRLPSGLSWPRT